MTVDLRSLLTAPELGLSLRYGEPLLDRAVSWVVTTDLHDPRRYLSGGELVLTGMMWRHGEGDSELFVRRLVAAGVVGLGAGDPELADLPADLEEACRRHHLPLFHVRSDVSFSAITEYVVRRLSAGRSADLAAVLGRHRSLIETGGGLADVLGLVADEVGMGCGVLSPAGRLVQGSTAVGEEQRRRIVAEVARGTPLPFLLEDRGGRGACSVFGLHAASTPGRLLVVDDDHTRWPPQRRSVVDELVAMVALDFDSRLRETETEEDLVALLDEGADPATVAARVRLAGLDPEAPLAVAVLAGERVERSAAVLMEAVEPVAEVFGWARHGAGAVAVVQLPDAGAGADLVANARAELAAAGMSDGQRLTMGVSEPVESCDGLVGALVEARHAQQVAATKPGTAAVAGADELSSHELLLASVPADVRLAFQSRVLGPLVQYDERHTSDLLHTLEVFLECSGSWSRAADGLHVHVNTLRYRIERIEQLTGRDLRQLPDLVDLHLALQLR